MKLLNFFEVKSFLLVSELFSLKRGNNFSWEGEVHLDLVLGRSRVDGFVSCLILLNNSNRIT